MIIEPISSWLFILFRMLFKSILNVVAIIVRRYIYQTLDLFHSSCSSPPLSDWGQPRLIEDALPRSLRKIHWTFSVSTFRWVTTYVMCLPYRLCVGSWGWQRPGVQKAVGGIRNFHIVLTLGVPPFPICSCWSLCSLVVGSFVGERCSASSTPSSVFIVYQEC